MSTLYCTDCNGFIMLDSCEVNIEEKSDYFLESDEVSRHLAVKGCLLVHFIVLQYIVSY